MEEGPQRGEEKHVESRHNLATEHVIDEKQASLSWSVLGNLEKGSFSYIWMCIQQKREHK